MENKIASFISWVFQPLWVPFVAFLIIFNSNVYFAEILPFETKLTVLVIIFISTIVLPVAVLSILKILKIIDSFLLKERNQRNMPYIFMIIFYYLTYFLLSRASLPIIYSLLALLSTLLVIIAFFINLYFKISVHTLSWGSLTGILVGLSYRYNINFSAIIILLIFISGCVAYSRLQLKAHREIEVYSGFFLGFFFMSGMFILL